MPAQETVTVACKLPNGLLCRIFAPKQELEPVLGGGFREVTRYHETGQSFVLNGVAGEAGYMPPERRSDGRPGKGNAQMLDEGFALTFGVPKDLWDIWYDANKNSDFIKNGLVFAHKQQASVKKQARDHEKLKSGFEPVDPENPAPGIEPTEEMRKTLGGNRVRAH